VDQFLAFQAEISAPLGRISGGAGLSGSLWLDNPAWDFTAPFFSILLLSI
jgi:hypothetical protein